MCLVSAIYDKYEPIIPRIPFWPPQTPEVVPYEPPPTETKPFTPVVPWMPSIPTEELRKLIEEFREAVAAAKKVDARFGERDCLDPSKAKLEERIDALEKAIAKLTRKKPAKRRGRK